MPDPSTSETARLEGLWSGAFGHAYGQRNREAYKGRAPFWETLFAEFPMNSALEVGCSVGANLVWVAKHLPQQALTGIDINADALEILKRALPDVRTVKTAARDLPFPDASFDLVYTTGVLIHQPVEGLLDVMSEIVRCSARYVLCGEYHAADLTEVPYRGQTGALFKQDYGRIYQDNFPPLTLLKQGFLPREDGGWDDLTWWLFEKNN